MEEKELPDEKPIGDLCDPQPLFTATGEVTTPKNGTELAYYTTHTKLLGYAGIGFDSEGKYNNLGQPRAESLVPPTSLSTTTQFRHCNCWRPLTGGAETYETLDECEKRKCIPEFKALSSSAIWGKITTEVSGAPPPKGIFVRDLILPSLFTTGEHCDVVSPLGGCRLGVENHLIWDHDLDITDPINVALRVMPLDDGTTLGALWSHTFVRREGLVSDRDVATAGDIRNSWSLVRTPLLTLSALLGPIPTSPICGTGGCIPTYVGPALIDPKIVEFVETPTPARLVSGVSGQVFAIGSPGDPIIEVDKVLSRGVKTLLGQTGLRWVAPIEPLYRERFGGKGLQFAAVPVNWRAGSSQVYVAELTAQGIALVGEPTEQRFAVAGFAVAPPVSRMAATLPTTALEPGDRDGTRAILSGTERSLILLGGTHNGTPTGEIWRYSLDLQTWALDKQQSATPSAGIFSKTAGPGSLLAATYDDLRGSIVMLDEVTLPKIARRDRKGETAGELEAESDDEGGADAGAGFASYARILVYDLRTRASTVALHVPRLGEFDRFALVAEEEGSFILVVQRSPEGRAGSSKMLAEEKAWMAFRFTLSDKSEIAWTGFERGDGTIADDPFKTDKGVFLPVIDDGVQRMQRLDPRRAVPARALERM